MPQDLGTFCALRKTGSAPNENLPPVSFDRCFIRWEVFFYRARAEMLTPALELAITRAGAPRTVVGIAIAGMVLLPEGLASYRAARANRLQTSVNLALGSVLATIGLTIPAVAGASILLEKPLTLGLSAKEELLLALTLIVSLLTIGTGRTTVLQGIVHLVVFAAFLFLSVVP
jgi:Ca2+:H+ antiporter